MNQKTPNYRVLLKHVKAIEPVIGVNIRTEGTPCYFWVWFVICIYAHVFVLGVSLVGSNCEVTY